mmetsp:Transcript_6387/g.18398  ORF Transcript_6387/g.18398 Transcript_6387/m.18398 type:complete len:235 (-) Transcript_6387:346-1050(-)
MLLSCRATAPLPPAPTASPHALPGSWSRWGTSAVPKTPLQMQRLQVPRQQCPGHHRRPAPGRHQWWPSGAHPTAAARTRDRCTPPHVPSPGTGPTAGSVQHSRCRAQQGPEVTLAMPQPHPPPQRPAQPPPPRWWRQRPRQRGGTAGRCPAGPRRCVPAAAAPAGAPPASPPAPRRHGSVPGARRPAWTADGPAGTQPPRRHPPHYAGPMPHALPPPHHMRPAAHTTVPADLLP